MPQKAPLTHPNKENFLIKDARDNFDNTCKRSFTSLKNEVRNKKNRKGGGVHPPINHSPIKQVSICCLRCPIVLSDENDKDSVKTIDN